MPQSKRILLAVDQSPASRRAVDYVAEMLDGGAGFHVGLLHLEAPPHMLEWGGAEDSRVEDEMSEERSEEYQMMEKMSISEGKALLQRYHALLCQKGVDVSVLLVQFEEPMTRKNIADHVLKTAREREYGTVVVGRHIFSLWDRMFRHHVGERLVHTGEGLSIWVVG